MATGNNTSDQAGKKDSHLKEKPGNVRLNEEKFEHLIGEIDDYAIFLINTDGIILTWNKGAERIKGYSSKEAIGQSYTIFYPKEDKHNGLPARLLNEAREKGKAKHEGWRVRKDGTRFWGSIVITALHNSRGEVVGFSKVTRDLTEPKLAEDALKKRALELELKTKELEQLNNELSSFVYVVSHDLKEPIRKIRIFATRLLEPDKPLPQLREFSAKIVSSASRMQRLLDDLLSYAQLSDHMPEPQEIDLNVVVNTAITDLEILSKEKNASFQIGTLPTIKGISFQLYQLFLNLLSNALKFSRNTEPPLITVSSSEVRRDELPKLTFSNAKTYNHIMVKDNGEGFDQEHAEKIFEVFQQLKTSSGSTGSGIGLSIVKKVAQNHHGLVTAESIPSVGTTFHVYLPAD